LRLFFLTTFSIFDVFFIKIPENCKNLQTTHNPNQSLLHNLQNFWQDIKKTIAVIAGINGLFALILFTSLNNFIGGVFMALMDAYGLSLVSVEIWGTLLGILSFSFILGGFLISKYGVGKPLKTIFLVNTITWTTCIIFPIQPSIILLVFWVFCMDAVNPICRSQRANYFAKISTTRASG